MRPCDILLPQWQVKLKFRLKKQVKMHILAFLRRPLVAMVTGSGPKGAFSERVLLSDFACEVWSGSNIFGGNYSILKFALDAITKKYQNRPSPHGVMG